MANYFQGLNDAALLIWAQNFYTVANTSPLTYSLSPTDLTAINTAVTGFDGAMTNLTAKETAYRAAVEQKRINRAALLNIVREYAAKFYANTAVDDAEISAIGLVPRDTDRGPINPQTPLDFIGEPRVDGTVRFQWKRNGNTYGVNFVLEQRVGDGAWDTVTITRKSTVTLEGYTPGTTVTFRVFAQNGDNMSPASNTFTIYESGGTGELSLAA
ncbi:MAG: hypothetical protein HONBIEJF_00420 [Fimbriimonadaceae bacterium]|nr:hypothetical protein [Fimbriimonadaceae bacterium]